MAQVTVQSGGYVTIPGSGTLNVTLQNQIANAILTAATSTGGSLFTATVPAGGPVPAVVGSPSVAEGLVTDAGGNSYSFNSYGYVLDNATGVDTISVAPSTGIISGTVGGVFNLTGGDSVALGGGNNLVQSSISSSFLPGDYVAAGNGNDTLTEAGGGTIAGGSTIAGGGGTNVLIAKSTAGSVSFISSGVGDTIGAGATIDVVTFDSVASGGVVFGGFDSHLTVTDFGTNDTIAGIDAVSIAATMSGSNGLLFGGGANTLSVLDTGTNDTISGQDASPMTVTLSGSGGVAAAGSGAATISATGTTAAQVIGGSGNLVFLGSAGTSTVRGGTGGSSIVGGSGGLVVSALNGFTAVTGGSGVVTLFGGAGSDVTYSSNATGLNYVAGSGSETLDASGSVGNDSLSGGTVSGANIVMAAGSGNDTLMVSGLTNNTLMGGSGHDLFAFFNANQQQQVSVVSSLVNLTSSDTVALIGYSQTDVSNMATLSASSKSVSVSYKLSDGTQISFLTGSGVHII